MDPKYIIRDEAALVDLYGQGSPAFLVKEVDHVHPLRDASAVQPLSKTRRFTTPAF
jgi:hypothetical protein